MSVFGPTFSEDGTSVLTGDFQKKLLDKDIDEISQWLSSVTKKEVSSKKDGFFVAIQDGTLLADLISKVAPDHSFTAKPDKRQGFFARQNVINFCEACTKIGVPKQSMFVADDLVERKSDKRVIHCLKALCQMYSNKNDSINTTGPEEEHKENQQNDEQNDEQNNEGPSKNGALEENNALEDDIDALPSLETEVDVLGVENDVEELITPGAKDLDIKELGQSGSSNGGHAQEEDENENDDENDITVSNSSYSSKPGPGGVKVKEKIEWPDSSSDEESDPAYDAYKRKERDPEIYVSLKKIQEDMEEYKAEEAKQPPWEPKETLSLTPENTRGDLTGNEEVVKQIIREGIPDEYPLPGIEVKIHYQGYYMKESGELIKFDSSRVSDEFAGPAKLLKVGKKDEPEDPWKQKQKEGMKKQKKDRKKKKKDNKNVEDDEDEDDEEVKSIPPGLEIGILTMKKYEKSRFTIAPEQVFGFEDYTPPQNLPHNSVVYYEVDLMDWKHEDIDYDKGIKKYTLRHGNPKKGVPNDFSTVKVKYSCVLPTQDFRTFIEEKTVDMVVLEDETVPEGFHECLKKLRVSEISRFWVLPNEKNGWLKDKQNEDPQNQLQKHDILRYDMELLEMDKQKLSYEMTTRERITYAMFCKTKGNRYWKNDRLEDAREKYRVGGNFVEDLVQKSRNVEDPTFEELQEGDKLRSICLSNMAACDMKKQEWARVIETCTKAIECDPSNVKALSRRSKSRFEITEYEGARDDLQSALLYAPNNTDLKRRLHNLKSLIKKNRKRERELYHGMFNNSPPEQKDQQPAKETSEIESLQQQQQDADEFIKDQNEEKKQDIPDGYEVVTGETSEYTPVSSG